MLAPAALVASAPAAASAQRPPSPAPPPPARRTICSSPRATRSAPAIATGLPQLAPRLAGHPLAPWVEYWQLQLRLRADDPARADADVAAFFARHPDTYVADRLRHGLAAGARRAPRLRPLCGRAAGA
ncbi:MAG: hypothetical protein MZW92_39545 [Comamonadaceae bacterium]|nr:hypothetical protein [Comamonadaceae bacterium]